MRKPKRPSNDAVPGDGDIHGPALKDSLASPALLRARLARIPSKAEVELWMARWPDLDGQFGLGHTARLERSLVQWISTEGKTGFRSAWVIALLSSRGLLVTHPEVGLMQAWHAAKDSGCRRECLRALLHLDLSDGAMEELLEWATQVVFLNDVPVAFLHHALRVMDRAISRPGFLQTHRFGGDLLEALIHLGHVDGSVHFKKKAALLRARLSN